jgi:hypothetical protein
MSFTSQVHMTLKAFCKESRIKSYEVSASSTFDLRLSDLRLFSCSQDFKLLRHAFQARAAIHSTPSTNPFR